LSAAIRIRQDFDAAALRRLATTVKDAGQVRLPKISRMGRSAVVLIEPHCSTAAMHSWLPQRVIKSRPGMSATTAAFPGTGHRDRRARGRDWWVIVCPSAFILVALPGSLFTNWSPARKTLAIGLLSYAQQSARITADNISADASLEFKNNAIPHTIGVL
jgi:hypothetical protein